MVTNFVLNKELFLLLMLNLSLIFFNLFLLKNRSIAFNSYSSRLYVINPSKCKECNKLDETLLAKDFPQIESNGVPYHKQSLAVTCDV